LVQSNFALLNLAFSTVTVTQAAIFVRKEVSIVIFTELTKLYISLTDFLRRIFVESAPMKRLVTAFALCLLTLGSVQNGFSQQRAGSLRGQVLDELGGAIVGASVTAIDATGKEKSVVTNDGGNYTINGLASGK
jgi:hypothetical protein